MLYLKKTPSDKLLELGEIERVDVPKYVHHYYYMAQENPPEPLELLTLQEKLEMPSSLGRYSPWVGYNGPDAWHQDGGSRKDDEPLIWSGLAFRGMFLCIGSDNFGTEFTIAPNSSIQEDPWKAYLYIQGDPWKIYYVDINLEHRTPPSAHHQPRICWRLYHEFTVDQVFQRAIRKLELR